MEVFKYLLQMFNTKSALTRQISLFSLVGIMVICLNNYTSSWTNMLFDNFYITPPANHIYIKVSLFIAFLIFFYLTGYGYKLFGSVSYDGKFSMPEFSLEPFTAFFKMILLFSVWLFYYAAIISVVCLLLYDYHNIMCYYVFYSIMLCLLPFVFIIFTEFAQNFKYEIKYFNVFYLFKILDKCLGDVIFLSLEVLISLIITVVLIYTVFLYSLNIKQEIWQFGVRYFGICLSVYVFTVLNYIYHIGLAKIAKTKFNQE